MSLTVRFFLHISYITRFDKFLEVPTQHIRYDHMIWGGGQGGGLKIVKDIKVVKT